MAKRSRGSARGEQSCPPSKSPKDAWAPEPGSYREWKEKRYPVQSALARACREKLKASKIAKTQADREDLLRASTEIARWVFPRPVITEEEAHRLAAESYENKKAILSISISGMRTVGEIPLLAEAFKADLGQEIKLQRMFTRKPKGRPAEMQLPAIYAYEAKLANGRLTWRYLTGQLCPCSKQEHDSYCMDNLYRAVKRLKTLIKKHLISLPYAPGQKSA